MNQTSKLSSMKMLFALALLLLTESNDVFAQDLPAHCKNDSDYRGELQAKGPVIAVGASVSSGLWAKPFPTLVAYQMCLQRGNGYSSRYSVLFFGAKLSFLKKMYIEQRPKIVIALDHLHHSSKSKKFDEVTRAYIDREFARISLDCRHAIVDCSETGEFHFVQQENYRPIVLLGDIYASYARDCSSVDPDQSNRRHDRIRNSIATRERGCIEDYKKINLYMRQKANEIPNLYLFPVNKFFQHLHRGLPFLYDHNDKLGSFYTEELFWDGFHPWSEPGSQIMANIVLAKLNELILTGSMPGTVPIPYIPIADRFYVPFTGIILIDDTHDGISPEEERRFASEHGEEFMFAFAEKTESFRIKNGDWGYPEFFERETSPIKTRVGDNPLVLTITQQSNNGHIVLSDKQISLIKRASGNSWSRLLGGVITKTK